MYFSFRNKQLKAHNRKLYSDIQRFIVILGNRLKKNSADLEY